MRTIIYIFVIFIVLTTMSSCTLEEIALAQSLGYTVNAETIRAAEEAKAAGATVSHIDPPIVPTKP